MQGNKEGIIERLQGVGSHAFEMPLERFSESHDCVKKLRHWQAIEEVIVR